MASPQPAPFPDTSAGRDPRAVRASFSPIVSKSAEFGTLALKVDVQPGDRSATASNISQPELEAEHLSSTNNLLVPQPPAVGSPAASISPRLRSVSSRTFKSALSVTQLPDTPDESSDFWLAPSPWMSPLPPGHESRCGADRRSVTKLRQTPIGTTPVTPKGGPISGGQTAVAGLGSDATSFEAPAEAGGDPWAALRAHCMAAYGGNLSSGDEDSDHEACGEAGYGGAGPIVLMRHPSLVRRSLSRSFADPTEARAAEPASAAAGLSRSRSGRRRSISGATAAAEGPTGGHMSGGVTSLTTAAATAAASLHAHSPPGPPVQATRSSTTSASGAVVDPIGKAKATAARQQRAGPTQPDALPERRPPCASTPQLTDALPDCARSFQTQPVASGKSPAPGRSSVGGAGPYRVYGSPMGTGSSMAASLVGTSPPRGVGVRSTPGASPTVSRQQGLLQRQQGVRGRTTSGGGSGGGAAAAVSPVRAASASSVASDQYETQQDNSVPHSAAIAALAALADSVDSTGGGGDEHQVSEGGGPVVAASASILDVATIRTDPVRMRRLSADGLNRHANKYSGDGAANPQGAPAAAAAADPDKGVQGSTNPVAAAASSPGHAEAATAGGCSPASPAYGASPPGAGRAPIITALAFERAPWSHQGAHAAGAHPVVQAASASTGGSIRGGASASPASVGPKLVSPPSFRSPAAATVLAVASATAPIGTPLHQQHRPQPQPQRNALGLAAAAAADRAAAIGAAAHPPSAHVSSNMAATATAATAVDKLRGYRSSKVLMSALVSPTSINGSLTQDTIPGASPVAAGAAASAARPTAITGLSPPRPKLGNFVSARTLRTTAAASSFLERLSNSSHLVGPSLGRTASRRTVGGGTDIGSELGGGGRRSFRRREGSVSLDGSGCDGVSGGNVDPVFGVEGGRGFRWGGGEGRGGGAEVVAEEAGDDGRMDTARQALGHAANVAPAAAGLYGRRSYKQLLPRGPNGLPLAWSAILEDGREGSDGGGGGSVGGKEGGSEAAEEEDDDEGFSLARMGGMVDLHQTC